jgi:hypothetical protein
VVPFFALCVAALYLFHLFRSGALTCQHRAQFLFPTIFDASEAFKYCDIYEASDALNAVIAFRNEENTRVTGVLPGTQIRVVVDFYK